MKENKNIDVKAWSVEKLNTEIAASEETLQKLMFAHAVTPIENPMRIRQTRRWIAKLKQTLHSKTREVVANEIKSGNVTNFNVKAYLQKAHLPTSMNVAKMKKLIAQTAKTSSK
jgi:large subunit ribosomal protein L29